MEDRNWDILNPWSTVFITQYKEIRHLPSLLHDIKKYDTYLR